MKSLDLRTMSVDDLWKLHEQLVEELANKIAAEKAKLEDRLNKLSVPLIAKETNERPRRPYPKVLPKYRNPSNPDETWAGRGKQPRWLRAQLRSGKKLDEFLIRRSAGR